MAAAPAAVALFRNALRLGLYQLRFLDRVPVYAAVDESIKSVRRMGEPGGGK